MATIRRILCPIDFSPPSRAALGHAADLARQLGASLLLLHVIPPPTYPTSSFAAATAFPGLHEHVRHQVEGRLAELRATLAANLPVETAVREGNPSDEIVAAAVDTGCDLIVTATHGHSGLRHVLLGSTVERVVRLSTVPVLTLRNPVDGPGSLSGIGS